MGYIRGNPTSWLAHEHAASGTAKSLQSQVKQAQTDIQDLKQSVKAAAASARANATTTGTGQATPANPQGSSNGGSTGGATQR